MAAAGDLPPGPPDLSSGTCQQSPKPDGPDLASRSPDLAPEPGTPDLSSGTSQGPTLTPRVVLLALLLLIALVLLPQLGFGLVYDDGWTLVANGFLRVPGELGVLFSPEAVARNIPDAVRPGLVLFDMLSYQLVGLDPRAHHALSIALHLGVCATLAAWLRRLGAPLALWASTLALFGLLAIHAEAIAVVSFHEDLLAALLAVLAALTASTAVRRARAWPLALVAALLSLGACAMKQSAATIAPLWLLAEGLAPWQARRPLAAPARPRPRAAARRRRPDRLQRVAARQHQPLWRRESAPARQSCRPRPGAGDVDPDPPLIPAADGAALRPRPRVQR